MALRYSELNVFKRCPLQWYLDFRIFGDASDKPPSTRPLQLGTVAHALIAEANGGDTVDVGEFIEEYGIEVVVEAQRIERLFDQHTQQILLPGDEIRPEQSLWRAAPFGEFRGTADVLVYGEDGNLRVVIDYKSTSKPPYTVIDDYYYSRQLEYYTWLARPTTLPIVGYYIVGSAKHASARTVKVDITEVSIGNMLEWMRTVVDKFEDTWHPASPGAHCKYCNYNLTCRGAKNDVSDYSKLDPELSMLRFDR